MTVPDGTNFCIGADPGVVVAAFTLAELEVGAEVSFGAGGGIGFSASRSGASLNPACMMLNAAVVNDSPVRSGITL